MKFFSKTNPVAALLSTIALFTAGFLVRPLGAFLFGWLGDRVGRKYTFLITLSVEYLALGRPRGAKPEGFENERVVVLLLSLLVGPVVGPDTRLDNELVDLTRRMADLGRSARGGVRMASF